VEQLEAMLERWQRAGIISSSQADRIRTAEASVRPERRIPLIAEVLGYVGVAFVLSAGGVLMSGLWEDLGVAARIGVLSLLTLLLVIAGWTIRDNDEPAVGRLASLLWLAAVAGVGATAAVVATDGLALGAGSSLLSGVAMTALGVTLWLLRRRALQLVGLFAGVTLLCTGLSDFARDDPFGLLLSVAGVAGIALARAGRLLPERSAYALSSLAVLLGIQWTAFDFFGPGESWAPTLGLLAALALLCLSVAWRSSVLLGFGSAGTFLFLPQVVDQYLGDTLGSTAALLVAGVLLLGISLLAVRMRDRVSS
jgi:uncharacterized membrane protein